MFICVFPVYTFSLEKYETDLKILFQWRKKWVQPSWGNKTKSGNHDAYVLQTEPWAILSTDRYLISMITEFVFRTCLCIAYRLIDEYAIVCIGGDKVCLPKKVQGCPLSLIAGICFDIQKSEWVSPMAGRGGDHRGTARGLTVGSCVGTRSHWFRKPRLVSRICDSHLVQIIKSCVLIKKNILGTHNVICTFNSIFKKCDAYQTDMTRRTDGKTY